MKFNKTYTYLLAATALLSSCIKDKGNYNYLTGNKVDIRYPASSLTIYVGDTLRYSPSRTFSNPSDTSDFDHAWYLNGKLYSNKPVLEYAATEVTGFSVAYYMTDRKTGITFTPPTFLILSISSPFVLGWGFLYQDAAGNSEVGHINVNATTGAYVDYTDLYKKANGSPMGTQPFKLAPYIMRGTPGIFVMQKGTPGPLDLSGNDMKKKLIASQSFTRGAPDNFEPVDFATFASGDLFVNKNGDLYARFFNGAAVFTIPWMSSPVSIAKGMQITDIWDSWYKTTLTGMLYDRLNKRVVWVDGSRFFPGGGVVMDSLPQPVTPYPANYTSLHNLGSWDYVWGGTFNDAYGILKGGMLIKNPADQQIYYEDFNFNNSQGKGTLTPGKRIPFTGTSLVNSNSKYVAVKLRDYIVFSGGANNTNLYYFDAIAGTVTQYTSFGSSINSITCSDDSQQIAVALEEGAVIIYDISNETMLSGKPKELHRLNNLGKVIDVFFKSYKTQ
ncbi:hypothetical protein DVR12_13620 [Chitinophaga silvatica]|uniref:PKD-like family protein n=1 Tax=Chitinophaga silvatica TaxID=2282649 RepID=A0A3E1Y8E9_9BACT|nr:PKD-like family lipoprotein [Chitinophaga silvatica]RFS21698.1 hypothetical protein DVR12_13620 [Chitinophaga silvatica]